MGIAATTAAMATAEVKKRLISIGSERVDELLQRAQIYS
jgi:hypothetical protein